MRPPLAGGMDDLEGGRGPWLGHNLARSTLVSKGRQDKVKAEFLRGLLD